jgi:hypothetical protein
VEGDVTISEAGTGDSPNPWSDDDDDSIPRKSSYSNVKIKFLE